MAVEAKVLADINGTSGIQTQPYATSVLATLRKGLTKLETAGYAAGSIVLHPTDWEGVELALSSTNAIEHLSLPYDPASRRLFGVRLWVAATPAAVLEQAARLAGACWAEASALATERHTAAEAVWAQEKKDLALEISELVADLDKVGAEKDAAVTELTARVTALETQAAAMKAQLEQARTAEQQASNTAAGAAARLAAAEARAETLQKAHDALLQRIVPETPDKNDRAKRTGGDPQL